MQQDINDVYNYNRENFEEIKQMQQENDESIILSLQSIKARIEKLLVMTAGRVNKKLSHMLTEVTNLKYGVEEDIFKED
jgi:hypothetical protein